MVTSGANVAYPRALDGSHCRARSFSDQTITKLGMRLANPCHENDSVPPPAGQEATFAATHTLTLANTQDASTLWRSHLRATAGVSKVAAVSASYCVP